VTTFWQEDPHCAEASFIHQKVKRFHAKKHTLHASPSFGGCASRKGASRKGASRPADWGAGVKLGFL